MLELLLIRHGQTDWNVERRVMGMEPIGINATGRAQMEQMAAGLAAVSLDAIIASPAQRTRESADCLVTTSNGLDVTENDAYGEIVYGEWVGRPFRDFDALPAFEQYMYAPSTVQIPGGERLVDTQRRAVEGVERIRTERTDGRVAIVTHADIIKLLVVHYLDMSIDDWQRFKVDNGSLSVLAFHHRHVKLRSLNLQHNFEKVFVMDGGQSKVW